MKTHFLWKTFNKIFRLKELSRAINWGQLSREQLLGGLLPLSNYLGGNYPGANCPGAIFLEAISRGQLSGGQLSWGATVRGAIVRGSIIGWGGAIVRGAIVLEPKTRWKHILHLRNPFLLCVFGWITAMETIILKESQLPWKTWITFFVWPLK